MTVNNWLRLFRGIMNEAVDELGLEKNPVIKVKGLDTSAHVTYTEEEPNALTPEEVGPFLAAMRDRHPQHLAMVALGFATGWRPSMMRPLRRSGPSANVLWDKNVVLARRAQTRGDEVREATKNSTRFRVTLPADVMAVLRWHTDRLPAEPMQESDLLFPSDTGGYRSPTVLDKPFKDVCKHLSLGKKVTPKAMRRTFQDLARRAAVDGLVQRSICGHLTEEMTRALQLGRAGKGRSGAREGRLAGRLPRSLAARRWWEETKWWESGGKDDHDSNHRRRLTVATHCYDLAFRERDTGFEPATFSLGKRKQPFRAVTGGDK